MRERRGEGKATQDETSGNFRVKESEEEPTHHLAVVVEDRDRLPVALQYKRHVLHERSAVLIHALLHAEDRCVAIEAELPPAQLWR